jgi:hypothetical protein
MVVPFLGSKSAAVASRRDADSGMKIIGIPRGNLEASFSLPGFPAADAE